MLILLECIKGLKHSLHELSLCCHYLLKRLMHVVVVATAVLGVVLIVGGIADLVGTTTPCVHHLTVGRTNGD